MEFSVSAPACPSKHAKIISEIANGASRQIATTRIEWRRLRFWRPQSQRGKKKKRKKFSRRAFQLPRRGHWILLTEQEQANCQDQRRGHSRHWERELRNRDCGVRSPITPAMYATFEPRLNVECSLFRTKGLSWQVVCLCEYSGCWPRRYRNWVLGTYVVYSSDIH